MGFVKKTGLVLVAGVICTGLWAGCQPQKAEADPLEGYRVAVVELPELMKVHPDYGKLEQLSGEIASLEKKKLELQKNAQQKLIEEGQGKMAEAVKKARAKLEAEQKQVEGEIAALSASLNAQVQAEMKGIQAQLEGELKDDIAALAPQSQQPDEPPPLDTNVEGQVQDYLQNLSLVRERNLAAKRLELEKRVGDEIAAKKAEVDGQLAAFEADLAGQYQSERLNLELTAQNSTDEEAKAQAEARLGEISAEIEQAKRAKRADLEAGYSSLRAEKMAALQGDLEAYQRELDAEVAQKLQAKRAELGGGIPAPRPAQPSGPPPEVKQKIAELESRMQGALASKRAEVESRMRAKIADSQVRLENKQKEIQKQLEELQIELEKEMKIAMDNLPEEMKGELEQIDSEIEKASDEREKLLEAIRSDISEKVAAVAEKKEQKMVLGVAYERNYFYKDPSFEDLTDLSLVKLQTAENK